MHNKIYKVDSTKTPVQARAFNGPATSGIEYDLGRDTLVLNPDGTRRSFPATFFHAYTLPGVLPATSTNYGPMFRAPYACTIVSVKMRYTGATPAGTVDIKKTPSGTAVGAGTSVLSSTMSTAGAVDTDVSGALSATVANTKLAAGDTLQAVGGGTLTALTNMVITVELKRTPDAA